MVLLFFLFPPICYEGGEVIAGVVIMATGAQSHQLGFFNNRLFPGFVSTIVTKPLPLTRNEKIVETDVFPPFQVIPMLGGRVKICGELQFPARDYYVCRPSTDALLEKYLNRFPQFAKVEVESERVEAIPLTIDNTPLFGR
jgi:glycine/D-amino acid oxidase-like deaminating enzyme